MASIEVIFAGCWFGHEQSQARSRPGNVPRGGLAGQWRGELVNPTNQRFGAVCAETLRAGEIR
jgi:hypothetical protein